jgi:hypothetical protein
MHTSSCVHANIIDLIINEMVDLHRCENVFFLLEVVIAFFTPMEADNKRI